MEQQSSSLWQRAEGAREQLSARFRDDPAVSLIDIGRPPDAAGPGAPLVLRVHVARDDGPAERFPAEIDGFKVVVMRGDYQLEAGAPADNFELIEGIGAATAARLHETGVRTFAELAALSPEAIAERLAPRMRVSADAIKKRQWVEHAAALAAEGTPEPAGEESGQHSYTLFHVTLTLDEHHEVFRTYVKCPRSNAEDQWAGWNVRRLEAFILAQAGVSGAALQHAAAPVSPEPPLGAAPPQGPAAAPPAPAPQAQPEPALDVPPPQEPAAAPASPEAAAEPELVLQADNLELRVIPAAWSGVGRGSAHRLEASVHFKLDGAQAGVAAARKTPYEFVIHAHELPGDTTRVLAAGAAFLQPDRLEYTARVAFPLPAAGNYSLKGVLRLPRYGVAAETEAFALQAAR
jgi:hypothetical protein